MWAFTSHKPMNDLDSMDELDCAWLPDWAVGSTTGICVGAQLPTKDGRRTGNAVVTGRKLTLSSGVRTWAVLTDAGNSLVLCDEEIKQLFYDPKWVMNVDSCPGRQRQQGADQELEACEEWLAIQLNCTDQEHIVPYLHDYRRPKPPSLKKQALEAHERSSFGRPGDRETILKAIEALPNE
jgi:hypothetical protein